MHASEKLHSSGHDHPSKTVHWKLAQQLRDGHQPIQRRQPLASSVLTVETGRVSLSWNTLEVVT